MLYLSFLLFYFFLNFTNAVFFGHSCIYNSCISLSFLHFPVIPCVFLSSLHFPVIPTFPCHSCISLSFLHFPVIPAFPCHSCISLSFLRRQESREILFSFAGKRLRSFVWQLHCFAPLDSKTQDAPLNLFSVYLKGSAVYPLIIINKNKYFLYAMCFFHLTVFFDVYILP